MEGVGAMICKVGVVVGVLGVYLLIGYFGRVVCCWWLKNSEG